MSGKAAFIWAGAILVRAPNCCRAPTLTCHFCFWFMASNSMGSTTRTPLGFMAVSTAVAASAAAVATALDCTNKQKCDGKVVNASATGKLLQSPTGHRTTKVHARSALWIYLVSVFFHHNGQHGNHICLCSRFLGVSQSLDGKQTTLSILVLSCNLHLVDNATSLNDKQTPSAQIQAAKTALSTNSDSKNSKYNRC